MHLYLVNYELRINKNPQRNHTLRVFGLVSSTIVRAIFSPLFLFKLCEENIKNLIVSIKFILYNKERNYHD